MKPYSWIFSGVSIIFGTIFMTASQSMSETNTEEKSPAEQLCSLSRNDIGLIGAPSAKLGDSLNSLGFPVELIDEARLREHDSLEISIYKSSGKLGNNPNLQLETIKCPDAKEMIVGISQSWAVSAGRYSLSAWLMTEYSELSKYSSYIDITAIDKNISLSLTKASMEIDEEFGTKAETILRRNCRISSEGDICAFGNATVYDAIIIKKNKGN